MSTLSECAEWHETRVKLIRMKRTVLDKMGATKYGEEEIAMHSRFAVAIREADTDEPEDQL